MKSSMSSVLYTSAPKQNDHAKTAAKKEGTEAGHVDSRLPKACCGSSRRLTKRFVVNGRGASLCCLLIEHLMSVDDRANYNHERVARGLQVIRSKSMTFPPESVLCVCATYVGLLPMLFTL